MTGSKQAYVGSTVGEFSLMLTFTDLVLNYDLGIPNFPAFSLQVPLQDLTGAEHIFNETFRAITEQMVGYLLAVGFPQPLVNELYQNIQAAIDTVEIEPPEGEPTLLEKIVLLEPTDLLELKFKIPDGFVGYVHEKIVTASVPGPIKRTPTPLRPPKNFQTGPGPGRIVQKPEPSLKNLITRYRGQQNKKLTGPIFVMVYDVNGRPVGVRQLKGPGWSGLGGKMAHGDSRLAIWLLPNGTTRDINATPAPEGGMATHANDARTHFVELGEDATNQEVLTYAFGHGWIRLWISGPSLAVQMASANRRSLGAVQVFIMEHPEWTTATTVHIEAGDKNWAVPMQHFLTVNSPQDLNREPLTASTRKQADPEMHYPGGKSKLFQRPDAREINAQALDLRAFLLQNGVRLTKRGLTQQGTGTFYLGFYGPVTHLERKIRISDHPAPVYTDKELALERHHDFTVDPDPDPGHTVADAKEWIKTARSFSGGDIPQNFWMAFDLSPRDDHFQATISQLKAGALQGVKGVSASGEILLDFLAVARNSFLRMPGYATVEANKMTRVMYDNPDYLLSNDMAPLYRIFNQNPERDWSRGECMFRIMEYVCRAMRDINADAFYAMEYVAAWQRVGRAFGQSGKKIKGLHDFIDWTHAAVQRALQTDFTDPKRAVIPAQDWIDAVRSGFHAFHKTYGSENEWQLKDSTLRIPEGSSLVIGLEQGEIEAHAKWETSTDLEREQAKFFGNHRTAERVKALMQAMDALQDDGRYTVKIINLTPFGKRRPDLLSKKWEGRRKENQSGYLGVASLRPKLFTREGV